jgi:zinc/manganese transport system permease protein
MTDIHSILIAPFADFAFMRRALIACMALSLGAGPVGIFLVLRRMSLTGDALSHAILPGAAIGFLVAGYSLWAIGLGGALAGVTVILLSALVSRLTILKEDASLAAFYLTSLAMGVMIVSVAGSGVDLLHLLFGSILAVDGAGLALVAALSSVTMFAMAVIYRPLVVESFDPVFMRSIGGPGALVHSIYLVLVVLNLVAGFQVLGTLMSVGLMMLPAASARLWTNSLPGMMLISVGAGIAASLAGLLISFHADWPSGPAIILSASAIYVASLIFGLEGGVLWRFIRGRHIHEPGH